MADTPVATILAAIITQIEVADTSAVVKQTLGIPGPESAESEYFKKRFGALVSGKPVVRGWWVEWVGHADAHYAQGHYNATDEWELHGRYQIDEQDPDASTATIIGIVDGVLSQFRGDATLGVSGITIIAPGGRGAAMLGMTADVRRFAGVDCFSPQINLTSRQRLTP